MHAQASRPDFSSDTNILVETCLARVRETARLDDDAVLPPLPVVMPRRDVVMLTKKEMAGSAPRSGPLQNGQESGACSAGTGDALRGGRHAPTQRVSRPGNLKVPTRSSRSWWALALCGFVAGGAASAAFFVSPVAQRPGVERVTRAARTHASHAAEVTLNATGSFFKR